MVRKIDSREHQVDTMSFSKSVDKGDKVQSLSRINDTKDKQLRFPLALKRARLAKKFKQETIAALLHVKLRTFVSWETGTRVPPIGVVALLCQLLKDEVHLDDELFITYIVDGLDHLAQAQEDAEQSIHMLAIRDHLAKVQLDDELEQDNETALSLFNDATLTEHVIREKSDQPTSQPDKNANEESLQKLFDILDVLHTHPELVTVTQDFLHEMTLE